jgi:hypothetical protein
LVTALLLGITMTCRATEISIGTAEHNGQPSVMLSSLASHRQVAAKPLPGTTHWVVCVADRCGLLKDVVRREDQAWVTAAALAEALGASAQFDPAGNKVKMTLLDGQQSAASAAPRVGSLAPNFRLTKLDGAPVALADFAGRRVLVNNWGSW